MISKNRIKYVRSLGQKKIRRQERVFVAEGHKLVGDMLRGGFKPAYIAALEGWIEENREIVCCSAIDCVTLDELQRISFVETPQQVLALFHTPDDWDDVDPVEAISSDLCLALDDVQNPGNLGTIIRLADWFGIRHIFCSQGCADVFSEKTVQATMGALVHVQVHYTDLPYLISTLPESTPIYGTHLDGENIYAKSLRQHGLIIMGNEGRGVSPEVSALVTDSLYIPNYPIGRETSESLNVAIATAVVCSEFRRQAAFLR